MRTHISLNVSNLQASVRFYETLFRKVPQKLTIDYAKFDVIQPPLNLSLIASPNNVSQVNHFGIEVDTPKDIESWKGFLTKEGLLDNVEEQVICCFALQDKIWVADPDGNRWEIFTVHEQLPVTKSLQETGGCCGSSHEYFNNDEFPSVRSDCAC